MSRFWRLRSGLPREGPGSDESTRKALQSVAASLPEAPRILDVGCGPGMQTLVLARETGGHVTAVDRHQPFLDELNRRGARDGLTDRITAVNASMSALDFPDGGFDLIWSEGAIYIMGFAGGPDTLRSLTSSCLRPLGGITTTHRSNGVSTRQRRTSSDDATDE